MVADNDLPMPVTGSAAQRRLSDAGTIARLLERAAEDPGGDLLGALVDELRALYDADLVIGLLAETAGRVRASTARELLASTIDTERLPALAPTRSLAALSIETAPSLRSAIGAPGAGGETESVVWQARLPLGVGERTLGLLVIESARRFAPSELRDNTAGSLAGVTAGLMLARQRPRLRGGEPRASNQNGGSSDGVQRRPTPVWGVMVNGMPRAKQVVVVEDDRDIAAEVKDTLTEEGYDVHAFHRADQALAHLRQSTADLVVLDVKLPDRDGFAVAADLARDRRTSRVPILFLSGAEDLATRVRSLRSEETDFLPKPFSFKELVTRVEQSILRAENRNRLVFSARVDELTGLGNLRLFEERLATEAARIARYGTPLCIVVLDLDRLKAVNDQHGHAAGSAVLRAVGEALAHAVRETDLAVRYGGDEFAVLLPHTNLDEGAAFAGRVVARVRELRPGGLAVSVSVGVAAFDKRVDRTVDDLFERADRAAYRAKREGGDRLYADSQVVTDLVDEMPTQPR